MYVTLNAYAEMCDIADDATLPVRWIDMKFTPMKKTSRVGRYGKLIECPNCGDIKGSIICPGVVSNAHNVRRWLTSMIGQLRWNDTQTRPANFYSNQVKVLLLIVVSILFFHSPAARNFTADSMRNVADVVDTYWDKWLF